jgi:hypothetical protein
MNHIEVHGGRVTEQRSAVEVTDTGSIVVCLMRCKSSDDAHAKSISRYHVKWLLKARTTQHLFHISFTTIRLTTDFSLKQPLTRHCSTISCNDITKILPPSQWSLQGYYLYRTGIMTFMTEVAMLLPWGLGLMYASSRVAHGNEMLQCLRWKSRLSSYGQDIALSMKVPG